MRCIRFRVPFVEFGDFRDLLEESVELSVSINL
jgi:hypothetical protein